MFREYFFDHRTLIVAGLILVCVFLYALMRRPNGARPKYYVIGHFLLGLGMAGFYFGATEGIMNGRLEIPFSHLAERLVQVAVLPGNAATVYGISICVAAAACIGCAMMLLRMDTQSLASTTARITKGR
jgi:hypothetical protein